MSNPTHTDVNADGAAVKVVQVASNGEQIGAAGIGLITAGPLGALAAWGAIRMFAGKWTPWLVTGFITAPILLLIQLAVIHSLSNSNSDNQSRIELIQPSPHT